MKKLFVVVAALMAVCSLSAQTPDLVTAYNAAAAAYSAKNYAVAASEFDKTIQLGAASEDAEDLKLVATAKSSIPKCYFFLGGGAIQKGALEEALTNFQKSADLAELYGDQQQAGRSKMWIGRSYQAQGGNAFNAKDYTKAAAAFEKGYQVDPSNVAMMLNLGMSYCEINRYPEGMDMLYKVTINKDPRYAKEVAEANRMMALYTNNEVAKLQKAKDYTGILTMADEILKLDANNPIAHKVRVQAYSDKKDYAKVIELAAAAAAVQTDAADASTIYYLLGSAYNANELKPQAIATLKKVVAGPSVAAARAAVAELSK
ncbi:MAG: tetratricopeptide repeat protein [Alistipes sp.]